MSLESTLTEKQSLYMRSPSVGSEFPVRSKGIPGSSQMVVTLSPSLQDPADSYHCLQLLASPPLHPGLCGFPATAYFGALGFRCRPRDLAFDSHILSLPRGSLPHALASCVHHPWEKLQGLTGCSVPSPSLCLHLAF